MNTRSPSSPTLIVAAAVFGQGVGTAFIGYLVAPTEAPFVALIANVFCMLVPVIYLCFRREHRRAPRTKQTFALIIGINVSTAAAFILYYIAVTLISPSASTVLEAGIGPLVLLVAGAVGIGSRASVFQAAITIALTLIVAGTAMYLLFFDAEMNDSEQWLGAAFSVAAGIGSVSSVLLSRSLARRGLSPMVINAYRFPLAILASALLCFVPASVTTQPWLNHENYVLALVAIALPILALQFGIGHLAPIKSALFLSTLPATVFITETLLTQSIDVPLLVMSFLIVTVSVGGVLIQSRWILPRRARDARNELVTSST